MPYCSLVDTNTIIEQVWLMIEADGVDALSLAKLAGALGVKAPSLYLESPMYSFYHARTLLRRAALRGLMALLHRFVMLEIHEQLRRGGDLGIDFEDAVRAYIAGWAAILLAAKQ